MSTFIKCEPTKKQQIKEVLQNRLDDMMNLIAADESDFCISDTDEGLYIGYPNGKITRNGEVYIDCIPKIFAELKEMYPQLGISGIVYVYEQMNSVTYGPVFYSNPTDSKLTITNDWQECAHCGKIIIGDACYNSSQRDFGEGNLQCLCSPTCMLEYSLGNSEMEVEANASISDDERKEIDERENDERLLNILWNRIKASLDKEEYIKDFTEKKNRIQELSESKSIDAEHQAVLHQILSRIC